MGLAVRKHDYREEDGSRHVTFLTGLTSFSCLGALEIPMLPSCSKVLLTRGLSDVFLLGASVYLCISACCLTRKAVALRSKSVA